MLAHTLFQTHNIALVTPLTGFIITIDQNGRVTGRKQDYKGTLGLDAESATKAESDIEVLSLVGAKVPGMAHKPPSADGKLVVAEEIEEGRVTWKSLKLFLSALGGNHPLFFFSLWILGLLLTEWSNSFQTWFLGYWGSQYEDHPASEVTELL